MADSEQPTQKTQPKKGEPMDIPVPTRDEWERNMERVAPPPRPANPEDRHTDDD
jgi:hypothetical protein